MEPNTHPQQDQPHIELWPPPRRRNRLRWTTWAVPVVTLLVGLAVGFAAASSDPTESPEYQEQAELLADRRDDVLAAEREADEAREDAERAVAGVESAVAARQAELDQREADLAAREQAASAPEPAPAPPPSSSPAPPRASTPAPAPQTGSGGTLGQQNARGKAQDYLEYTSFSRSGLIQQLEYEGFSNADATWAVDGLNANWHEQAAGKARDYLSYTSFSRSGLIQQLEYEGFTREQAEYGATAAGY